jgi:hypothetical protein
MSNGPAVTLAMAPAPLGKDVVAPLAEPVLLCGNVWVQTTYVLPGNCYKACINKGHSPSECSTKWVALCRTCWNQLLACAKSPAIPAQIRCHECPFTASMHRTPVAPGSRLTESAVQCGILESPSNWLCELLTVLDVATSANHDFPSIDADA